MKLTDYVSDIEFWMGSEASYMRVVESISAALQADYQDDEESDEDVPILAYDVVDSVAVIPVHGSLVNFDSPMNEYFGMVSYNAIRNTVIEAGGHDYVRSIMLDIDSPGGDAKAVDDLSNLIVRAGQYRPITAFTNGMMASAAYWIGSSASHILASKLAQVGSIGVISVTMEQTEMLKKEGIAVEVIRAGQYKALGNPYEKLSEEARAEMQLKVDQMYDIFVESVADNRGKTFLEVKNRMAEGRVFMAKDALEVGLIDEISNFEDAIKFTRDLNSPTGRSGFTDVGSTTTLGDGDMATKKKAFSEKDAAALQSGVKPEDLPKAKAEKKEEVKAKDVKVSDPKAKDAKLEDEGKKKVEPKLEAKEEQKAEVKDSKVEQTNDSEPLVMFLKEELSIARTALQDATFKLQNLEVEHANMQNDFTALCVIAQKSIQKMQIGLGNTQTDFDHLESDALIAEHARYTKLFNDTYPVEGVSKVDNTEEKVSVDPLHAARIQATKLK